MGYNEVIIRKKKDLSNMSPENDWLQRAFGRHFADEYEKGDQTFLEGVWTDDGYRGFEPDECSVVWKREQERPRTFGEIQGELEESLRIDDLDTPTFLRGTGFGGE